MLKISTEARKINVSQINRDGLQSRTHAKVTKVLMKIWFGMKKMVRQLNLEHKICRGVSNGWNRETFTHYISYSENY